MFLGGREAEHENAKRVLRFVLFCFVLRFVLFCFAFSQKRDRSDKSTLKIRESDMIKSAGKGAVRCTAINASGLAAMEAHGKRQDRTSQSRRVRESGPLIYKGLDLRDLYAAHMDGVRQNAGAKKPILHFILRYPPELLDEPEIGRFVGSKKDRQNMMLTQSVDFIDCTHGGDAVFAARVDLDEEGETIVDVFASPKYEKRTKRTKADETGVIWASATKFGRDLAMKHQDEIRRRHPDAKKAVTGPRAVGMALQSEFANFFLGMNKVPLAPKNQKSTRGQDRLEIEAYKEIQAEREKLDQERIQVEADQAAIIKKAQISAGRINADAEECAISMTKAAKKVDADLRKELDADRDQVNRDRAGFDKKMRSLDGIIDVIRAAFSYIGGEMGLTIKENIPDAIDQLEKHLAILAASEPADDPLDDAGPEC